MPSTFPSSDHVVSYNTRVDHLREDYNELNIQIVNCISLNSNRESKLSRAIVLKSMIHRASVVCCLDCVPSAYAVYKFFDFADHDTAIVQQSDSPEFNDSHLYPVLMNSELDEYLRSQVRHSYIYVHLFVDFNINFLNIVCRLLLCMCLMMLTMNSRRILARPQSRYCLLLRTVKLQTHLN